MSNQPHQDIKHNSRLLHLFPQDLRPYVLLARLERPIGVWLLLIPGLWAIALAGAGNTALQIKTAILFAIGSIVMRAAGCVINDIWDRDLDKSVERTATRPLASGQISVKQACIFLGALLLAGLLILLQFNKTTIVLGMLSIPFIIAYPLMKRITWWPQIFLGLTFNFSALMGWSALTGEISQTALVLYGSGILWTLAYDTIYAHQDKEDDALIGIKSTARLFGRYNCILVYLSYAASWALSIYAVGTHNFLCVFPAGIYALYLCRIWTPDDQKSALDIFKKSKIYGLILLIGFACATL